LYAPLNEEGIKNTECHGRGRFTEKACRTAIFFNVFACNDKVHVIYESTGFAFPLQRHEDGDVIIWGAIGNHPMDFFFGSRHGIMNADVLREEVLTPLCLGTHIVTEIQNKQFAPNWRPVLPVTFLPQDAPNKSAYPRVFWLGTHFRPVAHNVDEVDYFVRRYARESAFLVQDMCAITQIDTFNLTLSLYLEHPIEAMHLSYDGVHWQEPVNIQKALAVLYTISQVWV